MPLVDPQLVRDTFEQRQQVRAHYSVAGVLDVDRYDIDGEETPLVLGVRELDQAGINEGDRNWSNLHTVYTHGEGIIAAYADQIPELTTGDRIEWAEGNDAGQDALSEPRRGLRAADLLRREESRLLRRRQGRGGLRQRRALPAQCRG